MKLIGGTYPTRRPGCETGIDLVEMPAPVNTTTRRDWRAFGEMLQPIGPTPDHARGAKSQVQTPRSKRTMLALATAKTESLGKTNGSLRRFS